MKLNFRFSIVLFILVLVQACFPSKIITHNKDTNHLETFKEMSLDTLVKFIHTDQEIPFLSMKGDLIYESPHESLNSRIAMYSIKDSLCLIIIKKIGVEVFRILISNDSIQMLDRINQEYICGSYDTFTSAYRIHFPFYGIHDLLTNACFITADIYYESSVEKNHYIIKGYSETQQSEIFIDPVFHPFTFKLKNNTYNMTLQNKKRSLVNEKYIPSNFIVIIDDSNSVLFNIQLKWSDINLDPIKQIKFIIPDHYIKHNK